MDDETYLGDGCYASFDGWQVRLRAPREHGDHEVFLDHHVVVTFLEFLTEKGVISKRPTEPGT